MKMKEKIRTFVDEDKNQLKIISLLTASIFILKFYKFDKEIAFPSNIIFIFAPIMLIFIQDSLRSRFLWGVLVSSMISFFYKNWYHLDNHLYLFFYWIMAVFIACFIGAREDRIKYIKFNACYLVFFTMMISALQKIMSSSYMNGDFFLFTFLTDDRFFPLTFSLFKTNPYDLVKNKLILNESFIESNAVMLWGKSALLEKGSLIFSYFVVGGEFLLGLLFFIPSLSNFHYHFRLSLLFSFIFLVYLFVPVISFGYILTVFAYTLIDSKRKYSFFWKVSYLVLFLFLISLSDLPKNLYPLTKLFIYSPVLEYYQN